MRKSSTFNHTYVIQNQTESFMLSCTVTQIYINTNKSTLLGQKKEHNIMRQSWMLIRCGLFTLRVTSCEMSRLASYPNYAVIMVTCLQWKLGSTQACNVLILGPLGKSCSLKKNTPCGLHPRTSAHSHLPNISKIQLCRGIHPRYRWKLVRFFV